MLSVKTCRFHSNKNTFVCVDSKLADSQAASAACVVVETVTANNARIFFAVQFTDNCRVKLPAGTADDEDAFYLNATYAKKLQLTRGDKV